MEEILSLEAVAKRYECQPSTIQTWVRSGKLKATRVGRKLFFRSVDLLKFEEECRRKGAKR